MRTAGRGAALIWLAGCLPVHASETPVDFAYAYPVTASSQAAFYRVAIPRFVYENSARADLGDVRVFDRDGAMVLHLVRRVPQQEEIRRQRLPLFPVYAHTRAFGDDDLSLEIEKDADGTIVNVRSSAKAGGRQEVAGYLLDASAVKLPMHGLQLQWSGADFMGELRVEASDDLITWARLAQAPVAKLIHAGHTLDHGRIAFAAHQARYLRLSWAQRVVHVALSAASAETRAPPERARQWVSVGGTPRPQEAGSYRFLLRGAMPVDRARVMLPQPNTVITAQLYSRTDDQASWQWRGGGVVSNIQSDATLPDNELELSPSPPAKHWLLRVEQKEAGLGRGEPVLQLGWIADELVFVARGAPPYTLAFGHANAEPTAHGLDQLLARNAAARVADAQLGQLATLRGEAALRAPAVTPDWKRLSLWLVLVLGVAALGAMARRLLREL